MTPPTPETSRWLGQLAARLKSNPNFLAQTLAAYQRQEHLSDEALAWRLSMTADDLPRLALCKRPVTQGPAFHLAVQRIARFSGADELALLTLLRQVEVVESFQTLSTPMVDGVAPIANGALAAARDREETPDTSNPETDSSEGQEHDSQ